MRDFWRAIKFATLNKKLTFFAVSSALIMTGFSITIPYIYKNLFDLIEKTLRSGQTETIPNEFWWLIIVYGFSIIIADAFGQLNFYTTTIWYNKTREDLSKRVYQHLGSLSLSYFESNSTGKIKERIDKGVWELVDIMSDVFVDILPQIVFVVIASGILFSINPIFGLILFFCVPLFVLISIKFSPYLIKIQDSFRDSNEKLSGMATESIINIKTIKSYATEKRHYKKFTNQLLETIFHDIRYVIKRITMNFFRLIIMNFSQIIIVGLGVYWTLSGKITLGTFTLAWQYINKSMQPLWYITRLVDNIQRKMRSVKRVFEFLDTKPEVEDAKDAKSIKIYKGTIKFENISFGYKDRKVINSLNLEVPAGKVLAIVGKSGSGKTTLVKLLSRFYDLKSGKILIDGQNIAKVTQESLRKNIGVVLQDSILFNDTAANNIAYGRPAAKQTEIVSAAKKANADVFIKNLPDKYQTVVGERGVKLSGGEQQRINIARAILKNPPILVLDEATSSLDSESEKLIQDALWKLIEGRTTIIIAHRLSTIMRADLIVVMDKGRIIETGTHEDLVNGGGLYSRLFEIQSGGYIS